MNKVNDELIDIMVQMYRDEFDGLNQKEQALLAYRKIIELKKSCYCAKKQNMLTHDKIDESDRILAIIKASCGNAGYLKSLVLETMCESNLECSDLFKKSLVSYNNVLDNYRLLAQELRICNSLELSHLLTYMLWGGYFSVTKKHVYRLQNRLLLSGVHSFDVIKGRGVCLAYAELLRNYLNTCDKKAAMLDCYVSMDKNDISYDWRPSIQRNYIKEASRNTLYRVLVFLLKGLVSKTGNHSVTLIEENGKLFIYDTTNLAVLNVVDENTATLINGSGNYQINPLSTLILNPMADDNKLFERLFSGRVIEPAFNFDYVKDSFEETLEVINNNIKLLDDAYDNIHLELEVIDRQTDEIGGHFNSLKKIREMKKHK